MRTLLTSVLLFASVAAQADVKYLLPVSLVEPSPGAFGSLWVSEFTVFNRAKSDVEVALYRGCPIQCVVLVPSQGTMTAPPSISAAGGKNGPGDFLVLSDFAAANLSLNLRIQDVSRQALTFGTSLPVIRETDALIAASQFLDVPTDDRFRQMLRVYDFDSSLAARVDVRLFAPDGTLLAVGTLPLKTSLIPEQRLRRPGYAEIGWLAASFPQIRAFERVRVEVVPTTPGLRYWALVSVTNNETQHVTIIEPATP